MEVSPDVFALAQRIIATFDADTIKTEQVKQLQEKSDALKDLSLVNGESIAAQSERWKRIAAKVDIEESIEETKQTDFQR